MSESQVLRVRGLEKRYVGVDGPIEVLRGVDFDVHAGEAIAVVGSSGVGKSTLLQVIGGLDLPDAGSVEVGGTAVGRGAHAAAWRAERIGFVFQYHHLLPEFSALENVTFPFWIRGLEPGSRPGDLLDRVGLGPRRTHVPSRLSGGEQQRVAIARAVATGPQLVLADEPTGNLDPETGAQTFQVLRELQSEARFALVVATHAERMARRCDRVLRLQEGVLVELDEVDRARYFEGSVHPSGAGTML
ncbi:MAG: ABC transporter ATP-binding protein [Planctomycetota bacterium]|nr:ABC transporter ATP-binding protein [Planctomycetota bacterium]